MGVPPNGWFIMENPFKMEVWVYPYFKETPTSPTWLCSNPSVCAAEYQSRWLQIWVGFDPGTHMAMLAGAVPNVVGYITTITDTHMFAGQIPHSLLAILLDLRIFVIFNQSRRISKIKRLAWVPGDTCHKSCRNLSGACVFTSSPTKMEQVWRVPRCTCSELRIVMRLAMEWPLLPRAKASVTTAPLRPATAVWQKPGLLTLCSLLS